MLHEAVLLAGATIHIASRHRIAHPSWYFYYMFQLGFYIQGMVALVSFETKRKDFVELILHHSGVWHNLVPVRAFCYTHSDIFFCRCCGHSCAYTCFAVTIFLIVLSFSASQHRIGLNGKAPNAMAICRHSHTYAHNTQFLLCMTCLMCCSTSQKWCTISTSMANSIPRPSMPRRKCHSSSLPCCSSGRATGNCMADSAAPVTDCVLWCGRHRVYPAYIIWPSILCGNVLPVLHE